MQRCLLLLSLMTVLPCLSTGQWSIFSNVNTPVCTAPDSQHLAGITTDTHAGAIILWQDDRSGAVRGTLSVQRIDSAGYPLWTLNGVGVSAGLASQSQPTIVSDGSGGGIVIWSGGVSSTEILGQHINSAGILEWAAGGVRIGLGSDLVWPVAASDGSGGAVVAWANRNHPDWVTKNDMIVQRINTFGTLLWGSDGVKLTDTSAYRSQEIVTDGSGGAIVVWEDSRNGGHDLYAQRVGSSGTILWSTGGLPVLTHIWSNAGYVTIADGKGGAIIAYEGVTMVDHNSILGQRVTATGILPWTTASLGGDTLANGDNFADPFVLRLSSMVTNDSGGAYIAMSGNNHNAMVQQVDSNGTRLWHSRGFRLSQFLTDRMVVARDGSGGVIAIWPDYQLGFANTDIYAQRFQRDGARLWGSKPVVLTTSPGNQITPLAVGHGAGSVIVAWNDFRSGSEHIYCNTRVVVGMIRTFHASPEFIDWVGPAVDMFITPGSGSGSPFDIAVAKHFAVPENPTFNLQSVSAIATGVYYTIDAPDIPQGQTFSADIGFHYDPAEIFGTINPGPPNLQSLRMVTREDTGAAYGVFDIPAGQQAYDVQNNRLMVSGVDHFSEWSFAAVPETAVVSIQEGWNLLSVPYRAASLQKVALFPSAISEAFGYAGGYITEPLLANGEGFWIKFPANSFQQQMTGISFIYDSIDVHPGWNIIGSLSRAVGVTDITSYPASITTSSFFGYNPGGGYTTTDSIRPGNGYWVKLSQGGRLVLASPGGMIAQNRIRILRTAEQPPPLPDGRPVSGTVPKIFALGQNYPNPFNPVTGITYSLPLESKVRLKVYNMLGQVVATLVDRVEPAGIKSIEWNASNAASGIYYYRLEATSIADPGRSFSQVRKMILAR